MAQALSEVVLRHFYIHSIKKPMIKRTLYFGNPAYLSLHNGQLVLKLPEIERSDKVAEAIRQEAVRTFPIEDLGIVVLDHKQITITQGVMAALLANNCAVITCDSKSMPTGLLLPLNGNTLQSERFQNQIEASLPLRKQLWQQTIRAKIENQSEILKQYTDTEVRCMQVWSSEVRSGDSENLEGRSAAYYWKHIFNREIPHFVRGREEAPPNNLLNYGYAILRAVIARALVGSGLLPTLGIHHHNRYNAYCLADDIMEPYRPYVDECVLKIVRSHANYETLSKDLKAQLLGIPTLEVCIDGKRRPLMVAASTTTSSLAKCYNGEARLLLYPKR